MGPVREGPTVLGMRSGVPPFVRTTSSVLTTFPIFYAICMRNYHIIIGDVVEGAPCA